MTKRLMLETPNRRPQPSKVLLRIVRDAEEAEQAATGRRLVEGPQAERSVTTPERVSYRYD